MLLRAGIVGEWREYLPDRLPQGRLIARLAAGLAAFACAAAWAGPPATGLASVELSAGHENLSSPLFRLTPEGTLVRLPGLSRLSGSYGRVVAGGMRDWPLADEGRLAVAGRADWKRAPASPDLDFGMVSADLTWRTPAAGGFAGVGPGLRRMWVAGERFRDVAALQADWTRPVEAGGFWSGALELAVNQHAEAFTDLDSCVMLLSLHRKAMAPLPGIDALDLELSLTRERNANGFADLASRSLFARASADRRWRGVVWSAGVMVQRARFDASLLDTLPPRRDRLLGLEMAAEVELAPQRSLRFELLSLRNRANLVLFENRYRLAALTFVAGW